MCSRAVFVELAQTVHTTCQVGDFDPILNQHPGVSGDRATTLLLIVCQGFNGSALRLIAESHIFDACVQTIKIFYQFTRVLGCRVVESTQMLYTQFQMVNINDPRAVICTL